ncbi:MAG: FAD-dependent thymidylate synthase, partial [Methanothrix sp.]
GKHTPRAQAQKYVDNILEQRHGSVLEHANFTLFLYGISRSLTHELVRHRAGFAYSQLSQRYVYGSRMRFVERPEFIHQPKLHALFEAQIDQFAKLYEETATSLLSLQEEGQDKLLTPEAKTDQRKAVNQTARTFLPNCTETQIVVTANVRAWRHFLEMRGSIHAETEIRMLSGRILTVLQELAPTLFADFLVSEVAGLPVLKSAHLKA